MDRQLKVGDVFELKMNQEVYAKVPEKYFMSNALLSNKIKKHEVVVGEVYTSPSEKQISELKRATIIEISIILEKRLSISDHCNEEIMNLINKYCPSIKKESYVVKPGAFVVKETRLTGGGTGHGRHDEYPDGHLVIAKRLKDGKYDNEGEEIEFFQSGCFTSMIFPKDIELISKMEMTFI